MKLSSESNHTNAESQRSRIVNELHGIEREEDVTIIYACEAGSRAWGVASEESDYDVRFVYLHRTSWYLTLQQKRDVIERPIDDGLDICGWDLTKALKLLSKSNPPLLEWLQSPIVYAEHPGAMKEFRDLVPRAYSPISCTFHYLHMAEGNYRKYLLRDAVSSKNYLNALRPILACRWIERGMGLVPCNFRELMLATLEKGALTEEIDQLLKLKMSGNDPVGGAQRPIIIEFLESELQRLNAGSEGAPDGIGMEELDECFKCLLELVNG